MITNLKAGWFQDNQHFVIILEGNIRDRTYLDEVGSYVKPLVKKHTPKGVIKGYSPIILNNMPAIVFMIDNDPCVINMFEESGIFVMKEYEEIPDSYKIMNEDVKKLLNFLY